MLNTVTLKRQHNRRWHEICTMTTTFKMLVIIVIVLMVLSASAMPSTSAKSEINILKTIETSLEIKNTTVTVKDFKPETRQYPYNSFVLPPPAIPSAPTGCPLCDSSVYSYCSHKLMHDSCCCDFPGTFIHQKPPQCAYNDCTLMYAKSCFEHSLIKNCCCNNPY